MSSLKNKRLPVDTVFKNLHELFQNYPTIKEAFSNQLPSTLKSKFISCCSIESRKKLDEKFIGKTSIKIEPVVARLKPKQVPVIDLNSDENIDYNNNSNIDVCPICHNKPSSPAKAPCSHKCCYKCWIQWLEQKCECPVCRAPTHCIIDLFTISFG
ncbi:hypothetical protein ROZALSC1DRAFT_32003 [Rozella allomycis CSF55]|uniref:RING-type domain-containing protein n=1 Tax=Rozella allomycis (strain CSF55) TaxID=988480 RepID=A0A4P9Y966_ROZAC|nr:hypothetical protein ROZALSC1DRAFT_32003 [Rozella allomycis CSF55]